MLCRRYRNSITHIQYCHRSRREKVMQYNAESTLTRGAYKRRFAQSGIRGYSSRGCSLLFCFLVAAEKGELLLTSIASCVGSVLCSEMDG